MGIQKCVCLLCSWNEIIAHFTKRCDTDVRLKRVEDPGVDAFIQKPHCCVMSDNLHTYKKN